MGHPEVLEGVGLHGHLLPGGWLPQVPPPLLPPRRRPLPGWPVAAVAGLADAPELEATWNPGTNFERVLIEEEMKINILGFCFNKSCGGIFQ